MNRMILSLGTATLMAISIASASAKDKLSDAFLKRPSRAILLKSAWEILRRRMVKAMTSNRMAKCFPQITPQPIKGL